MITSLAGSLYNHSSWTVKLDPDHANRWMIEIADAGAFPDTLLRGNEGFINRLCAELGFQDLWHGERPQGDLIRYRMTHSPF